MIQGTKVILDDLAEVQREYLAECSMSCTKPILAHLEDLVESDETSSSSDLKPDDKSTRQIAQEKQFDDDSSGETYDYRSPDITSSSESNDLDGSYYNLSMRMDEPSSNQTYHEESDSSYQESNNSDQESNDSNQSRNNHDVETSPDGDSYHPSDDSGDQNKEHSIVHDDENEEADDSNDANGTNATEDFFTDGSEATILTPERPDQTNHGVFSTPTKARYESSLASKQSISKVTPTRTTVARIFCEYGREIPTIIMPGNSEAISERFTAISTASNGSPRKNPGRQAAITPLRRYPLSENSIQPVRLSHYTRAAKRVPRKTKSSETINPRSKQRLRTDNIIGLSTSGHERSNPDVRIEVDVINRLRHEAENVSASIRPRPPFKTITHVNPDYNDGYRSDTMDGDRHQTPPCNTPTTLSTSENSAVCRNSANGTCLRQAKSSARPHQIRNRT